MVFIPIVGGIMQLIIPAAAVVLGFIGKRKEPAAKGMWLTGIILGFVGIAIALLSLVFWGIALATLPGYVDYNVLRRMMSDREGVSPAGGAPDRPPAEPDGDPAATAAEPAGNAVEPAAKAAEPAATAAESPAVPAANVAVPLAFEDAVAPPTEPTLRADPSVRREFEVPFDTGELRSLPTGQLLVVHRPELVQESPDADEEDTQRRVYSWIAAVVGIIGAAASLFVGWMLPLSIAAIVFGVLGLRREEEGRTLAFVGIGTGIAGLVFAAVWIGYYAIVFGALPH